MSYTKEQIIEIMNKPKDANREPEYRAIWLQVVGQPFRPSGCCGTFNRLYDLCKNYSIKIQTEKPKNNE